MRFHSLAVLTIVVAPMLALGPASARPWKPTPEALAQDYSTIVDSREPHRAILLYWASAPGIRNARATSSVDREGVELLDRYVLIGVADAQISSGGTFTFAEISAPGVSANGTALKFLPPSDLPPVVAGGFIAIQSVFAKSLGQLGAGIHWFSYDAGGFRACGSGRLSVAYGGETYTYEAPIPGCPTI